MKQSEIRSGAVYENQNGIRATPQRIPSRFGDYVRVVFADGEEVMAVDDFARWAVREVKP